MLFRSDQSKLDHSTGHATRVAWPVECGLSIYLVGFKARGDGPSGFFRGLFMKHRGKTLGIKVCFQ